MKSPVEVVKPRLTGAETAATKDEDLQVQKSPVERVS